MSQPQSVAKRWGHPSAAFKQSRGRGGVAATKNGRSTARVDKALLLTTAHAPNATQAVRLDLSSFGLTQSEPDDLREFTSVRCVLAGDNRLPFAAFAALPRLQILELQLNGLDVLAFDPARDYQQLSVLDLSFNALSTDSVATLALLPHLASLELSHNDLTALPPNLSDGFGALQHLGLDDNALESPGVFQALAGLGRLASLSMARNRVAFVPALVPDGHDDSGKGNSQNEPIALPFPMLQVLGLAGNRVTAPEDLEALATWPSLVQVLLWDNPLVTTRRALPKALRAHLQAHGVHIARKAPPPPSPHFRCPALPSLAALVTVDTQPLDFTHLKGSPLGPPLRYIRDVLQPSLDTQATTTRPILDDAIDTYSSDDVSYVSSLEPRPDSDARLSTAVAVSMVGHLGSFFLTSGGMDDTESDGSGDTVAAEGVDDLDGFAAAAIEPRSVAHGPAVLTAQPTLALPLIAQAKAHAAAVFATADDLRLDHGVWNPRENAPITSRAAAHALRHVLQRAQAGLDTPPASLPLTRHPDQRALLKPRRPTALPPLHKLVDTLQSHTRPV